MSITMPMDQTIRPDADGNATVIVVEDGKAQRYRCNADDYSDLTKNNYRVVEWQANNPMPAVDPYTPPTLAEVKAAKVKAIDAKTAQLIEAGFAYAGQNFSASEAAQRNWIGLASANANGLLSFPLQISTVDEGAYSLETENDLLAFVGTFLLYQTDASAPLGSGRALKALVNACTTVEEVNAIEDER